MALDENMDKIREIIASAEEEIKSIEVEKDIPLELDLGNLLVTDNNEIDKGKFSDENEVEEYLKSLARDGVQSIINAVYELPTDTIDNNIYALIPKPTTRLPREKPVPKPKPLTKWEQYAKEKGIKKTKKPTKIWDEILKEWVPKYGYLKAAAERKKNWVLEVPENADPFEDQFRKMSEKKKERVARNEYQRLSNIARAKNVKVPKLGVTSETMKSKFEMKTALEQTRLSTASLGKFQKTLQKEKPLPERKRGEKRKLPATNNSFAGIEQERKRSLTILSKMKKSELDYEMAVNKQIKMENVAMSHTGKKNANSGRRSKRGGRQRGKSEYKALSKGLSQKIKSKGSKGSNASRGSKGSNASRGSKGKQSGGKKRRK
ncbi:UNVERIFIED_CONTAM: hypothetical protein RMT77_007098 [Armadillidium vulgare]